LKRVGDPEDGLYFVVSGKLQRSTFKISEVEDGENWESTTFLYENDYFGDIYPFTENKSAVCQIETATSAELIKIPKQKMVHICRKHTSVELALISLCGIRSSPPEEGLSEMVRKAERYQLPLKMEIEIIAEGIPNQTLIVRGYSRDISTGGMCVVLEAEDLDLTTDMLSFGESIKGAPLRITFLANALAVKVSGYVIWHRPVYLKSRKTLALGVGFEEMSPKLRGMLFQFANVLHKNEGDSEVSEEIVNY
jgi:hypothetical protein